VPAYGQTPISAPCRTQPRIPERPKYLLNPRWQPIRSLYSGILRADQPFNPHKVDSGSVQVVFSAMLRRPPLDRNTRTHAPEHCRASLKTSPGQKHENSRAGALPSKPKDFRPAAPKSELCTSGAYSGRGQRIGKHFATREDLLFRAPKFETTGQIKVRDGDDTSKWNVRAAPAISFCARRRNRARPRIKTERAKEILLSPR